MSGTRLRVLVVRNEDAGTQEVGRALTYISDSPIVREARTLVELREAVAEFEPDVVLFRHPANGIDPQEALAILRRERPPAAFILVGGKLDDEDVIASLRAGADGVVLGSNLARMGVALRTALERRRQLRTLTPRQIEVLRLVAEGCTSRQIADELGLSIKTIETHRGEIMRRLGIHDLVGLVHFAIRLRVVAPRD